MSWYKTDYKFTEQQQRYFWLLERTFRIADAHGELMDYVPLDYQKEMHSVVPMALPKEEWSNVWTYKGRGIGASRCRMMDMILHCLNYKNIVFPILIHRERTGKEWIKVAQELIETAKIDLKAEIKTPYTKTEIFFKNTGSKILLFPSNNINSLRFVRTFFIILDEIEFFRDIQGVLGAAKSCMNQGGVGLFQSTVCSRTSYFWEMREKFMKEGIKHGIMQNYPVFDPTKFESTIPIPEQIKKGLEPIGFWYNVNKLEEERDSDIPIFMQENQIVPISDTDSWYPFNLVMSCVGEELIATEHFNTINPIYIGIDFGRNHDFTTISVFEKTEYGYVQKFQKFIQKMSMPEQRMYIEGLIETLKPTRVRTDYTGMGMGISEELQKKFGSIVEPVTFTKPSKEKMATNLKALMSDSNILFLKDPMLIKHMSSVNYELKSVRDSETGHADAAWSIALAVLPEGFQSKNITVGAAFGKSKIKVDENKSRFETAREFIDSKRNEKEEQKVLYDKRVEQERYKIHDKIVRRIKDLKFFCIKRKENKDRYFCANCNIEGCTELQITKNLITQGGETYEKFKEIEREDRNDPIQ